MKKKFLAFLLTICVALGSLVGLTGCSLVSDSSSRYYDEVVAYVGDKTITREELLSYYSNYSYYTYYGYTSEQVFDMVYSMLINQKAFLSEAEKQVTLTITDENAIWESVRETINGYLDTYEDTVRTDLKAAARASEEAEDEELDVFAEYVRSLPGGKVTAKTDTIVNSGFELPKKADNYYRYLAMNNYLSQLVKQAKIKGENLSSEEAFDKELQRLYSAAKDSKYVELYQTKIKQGITISQQEIVDRYVQLLNTEIQSYAVADTYSTAVTTTSGDSLVLYHDAADNSYFYIQQILIPFSEQQTSDMKAHIGYVASSESTYTGEQSDKDNFLAYRDSLAQQIEFEYVDSNGDTQTKTFSQVLTELQTIEDAYLASGKTETDARNMAKSYFEKKFYYSTDQVTNSDGEVSATTRDLDSLWNLLGYVFDSSDRTKDSFMQEFSDKAYELYDNYISNGEYGIDYCVTSYGVHFMLFAGLNKAGAVAESNYASLAATKFTMVSDETIADYIYEIILEEKESSTVSDTVSSIKSALYQEAKINKIVKSYEDFIK